MPYIKQKERDFILTDQGLDRLVEWLHTMPVTNRKGFVAYIINYIGKHSFDYNYFGKSTGLDAVRSAFTEMKRDLFNYECLKKAENGDV